MILYEVDLLTWAYTVINQNLMFMAGLFPKMPQFDKTQKLKGKPTGLGVHIPRTQFHTTSEEKHAVCFVHLHIRQKVETNITN